MIHQQPDGRKFTRRWDISIPSRSPGTTFQLKSGKMGRAPWYNRSSAMSSNKRITSSIPTSNILLGTPPCSLALARGLPSSLHPASSLERVERKVPLPVDVSSSFQLHATPLQCCAFSSVSHFFLFNKDFHRPIRSIKNKIEAWLTSSNYNFGIISCIY
jgi:hypothetical protein